MQNDSETFETLEDAEIAVLAAERSKFLAEAEELRRPLFRRPAFWGALLPGAAAAATAYFAVTSQFLDVADDKAAAALDRASAAADKAQAEKKLFDAETLLAQNALKEAQAAFDARKQEIDDELKALEDRLAEKEIAFSEREAELTGTISDLQAREEALLEKEQQLLQSIELAEKEAEDRPLITALEAFASEEDYYASREWLDTASKLYDRHPDPVRAERIRQTVAVSKQDDFEVWSLVLMSFSPSMLDLATYDTLLTRAEDEASKAQLDARHFDALSYRYLPDETAEMRLRRCEILTAVLLSPGLTNAGSAESNLQSCLSFGAGELDIADVRRMVAVVFEVSSARIEERDESFLGLNEYYAAEAVGLVDQFAADLLIARSLALHSFNLDSYGRTLLSEYAEGDFGENALDGVASSDLAVWRAFWETNAGQYDVGAIARAIREGR